MHCDRVESGYNGGVLVALLILFTLLSGCASTIMPAPKLYEDSEHSVFEALPPELKSPKVDVLYVTDRSPELDEAGNLTYGYNRSSSVAFGSAIVDLGHNLTWEELVDYSVGDYEGSRPKVGVDSITELGRFPSTPYQFRIVETQGVTLHPQVFVEREQMIEKAKEEILRRMALTPRNEIFIYVHGIDNSFNDVVVSAAEGWHFMGREGVLVAYSWPAGRGGALSYGYDRESGEFTIFHLKQFLTALASISEVEKVHLIAHSRGTDVVTTAIRELLLETRGGGLNTREKFKFGNVVLIAPDLDFEVTMQRLVAEGVGTAIERISIYTSKDDSAIGAARKLFSSWLRVGQLEARELNDEQRQILSDIANMDVITYRGGIGGRFGHSYFLYNPAVSSDIIALLRYGKLPGKENGRPLQPVAVNFWLIDDSYLQ